MALSGTNRTNSFHFQKIQEAPLWLDLHRVHLFRGSLHASDTHCVLNTIWHSIPVLVLEYLLSCTCLVFPSNTSTFNQNGLVVSWYDGISIL